VDHNAEIVSGERKQNGEEKMAVRLLCSAIALVAFVNFAYANQYARCMLDNAPALQTATDNALDAIILSCIKLHEEPIGLPDVSDIQIQNSRVEVQNGGLVLIELIYNGSNYDITSITFNIKNKKTNDTQSYRYNQFIKYYRGPGIVTGPPAPQYKRFFKSKTSGEYEFPLDLPDVKNLSLFNEQYEMMPFFASGVR
jgi:hypothetical protein